MPSPSSSTVPAASWPMGCGSSPSIRPLRFFQLLGLTPAARTTIRTWPGPGCGSGTSTISRTSGPPKWLIRTAFNIRSDLDTGCRGCFAATICQPRVPGPGSAPRVTCCVWPGSGRGGEAVTGAAHGLQASGTVTELAAEGADHDLDDVAAAAPVVAPYVAQQRRAADDPAVAFVQVLQDIEFELGEIGAGAVEDELAAVGIQQSLVVDEHFPRGEVGQPAVDGGRSEVVVEGVVGGSPDLGAAVREKDEAEWRELEQRRGG